MSVTQPATYPFTAEKLDLSPLYSTLRKEQPLSRIQLPYGETAWLATRYEDARFVLSDPASAGTKASGVTSRACGPSPPRRTLS